MGGQPKQRTHRYICLDIISTQSEASTFLSELVISGAFLLLKRESWTFLTSTEQGLLQDTTRGQTSRQLNQLRRLMPSRRERNFLRELKDPRISTEEFQIWSRECESLL